MKNYIICCIPEQIPYLGKVLFLRYGPNVLSHFDTCSLHFDTNSHKLKVDQKKFEWAWSKICIASLAI